MSKPPPLTPQDCDLQDFSFMPLHVARLRDSDLAAQAHPEACWYAVLLWSASWHQLPAASLPDNDAVLAKLIGLGRDLKTFRRHKADAMRGFVLCSDGRLYHPMVAEQALESWNRKLQQRWRTEIGRIKKANQRTGRDDPLPSFEEFLAARPQGQGAPRPSSVPEDIEDCPEGHRVQETETGTGTPKKDSEDKSSAQNHPPMDHDAASWLAGVLLLQDRGNLSEKAARSFFGRLLSANGLEARDLLPSITKATINGTQDPQGYLTRAATNIASRRAPTEKKAVGFV